MTEPSRDTAGRRRRELLARARQLDKRFGPDQSVVVFEYGDGWTIRRVDRIEDQWREGELMRHCLRTVKRADPNAWSLRDPDNLPHLTFATYQVGPDDDLTEVPLDKAFLGSIWFVHAGDGLLMVDVARQRELTPERRRQLVTFLDLGDLTSCDTFPSDPAKRIHALLPNFNFDENMQRIANRIADRYAHSYKQRAAA